MHIKKGYHIDIFKKRPVVDKYNEVSNDIPWIICDMSEDMWLTLGGGSFQNNIVQEFSSFPFKNYATN